MTALWQMWWIWMVAGIALGIVELFLPGFVFLGFAVGAVLTGLGLWLGVLTVAMGWLLLWFAVLSLLAWIGFRRWAGVRRGQVKLWDRDINEN